MNAKVLHTARTKEEENTEHVGFAQEETILKVVDNKLDGLGKNRKERRKETQGEKRQRSKSKTRCRAKLKKKNT